MKPWAKQFRRMMGNRICRRRFHKMASYPTGVRCEKCGIPSALVTVVFGASR